METTRFLRTSDVAGLIGVHPQTLRGWERAGVIPPATRRRGIRVYTPSDVARIKEAVFQMPNDGDADR